eukprot:TRINITY_DN71626_c0_g1_i1.p1 TRINITY_DN71626_c0_g1~~TRINITY_DN71626_c0_g1_i1.p1  ORF type:complete len:444 (-),score=45.09 TRINITY_DN71626_c0_g1_i1:233-1510(-)
MSLAAGATLLSGLGHLANLGQFAEIGQAHAYQREQMQWARRAYCLDSRALRIDLLNAVKEDVRDHHQTYAGRIDTLLLVHTLLLTFALATLQYSDQFVPSSECVDCEEVEHPWMVFAWVYSVVGILILPFWSIVMLIWTKLQLDHWLENSLGRLNLELRSSLSAQALPELSPPSQTEGATANSISEKEGTLLLERVEGAVNRLSIFVAEHQDSFQRIWNRECRLMINASTVFLWVSCALAIAITAFMFWLFLENHMQGVHRTASTHFAVATLCGLVAPIGYAAVYGWRLQSREISPMADEFEDCIDLPSATGSTTLDATRGRLLGDADGQNAAHPVSRLRSAGRRLLSLRRWVANVTSRDREIGLSSDPREPCLDYEDPPIQMWARMSDEGLSMTDMASIAPRPSALDEGVEWQDMDEGIPGGGG